MKTNNKFKLYLFILILLVPFLNSCGPLKYKPVDAKEVSPNPKERVKKNIEEGRGWRLMGAVGNKGGTFDFASSNPL